MITDIQYKKFLDKVCEGARNIRLRLSGHHPDQHVATPEELRIAHDNIELRQELHEINVSFRDLLVQPIPEDRSPPPRQPQQARPAGLVGSQRNEGDEEVELDDVDLRYMGRM